MRARILTVAGMSVAAVALTTTTAAAAPAAKVPPPSVANTSQTFTLYSGGQEFNSDTVTFTDNTWSLASYPDTGTFTDKGARLTLKTATTGDKGCTYKGKYDARTTLYEGKFKCPKKMGGNTGTFTVTTTGVSGNAHPAARTHSPSFVH